MSVIFSEAGNQELDDAARFYGMEVEVSENAFDEKSKRR